MTPEQLLIPRYKVIADYPRSKYNIGDILELPVKVLCTNCATGEKRLEYAQTHGDTESDFDSYPAIFRRMAWSEERESDEWPEYLKSTWNGKIYSAKQHAAYHDRLDPTIFIPATEAEYLAQQK